MKGTATLVLVAATFVVCASGHPYTKIQDGSLEADGYHYKKSSSNSNSNSYSQSNSNDADINGSFGGQSFSGKKTSGYSTSGGSHSQSSNFASGNFNGQLPIAVLASGLPGLYSSDKSHGGYNPGGLEIGNPGTADLGLGENGAASFGSNSYGGSQGSGSSQAGGISTSYIGSSGGGQYLGQGARQPGAVQYWWNGANSPFGEDGKPSGGCGRTACTLSGSFDLSKGSGGAEAGNRGGQVGVNVNGGNPFFSKGPGGFVSSQGQSFESRPLDGSKNPFLNGGYAGSSASSFASSSGGSLGSGGSFASGFPSQETIKPGFIQSSTPAPGYVVVSQGSLNPFLNGYESSSPETLQDVGVSSTVAPDYAIGSQGSLNPFLNSGSSSSAGSFGSAFGGGVSSTVSPGGYEIPSQRPAFVASGSSNPFLNPGPSSGQNFYEQSTLAPTIFESSSPQSIDFDQSQSTIGGGSSSFGIDTGDQQISRFPSFPGSQSTINIGSSSVAYPTESTLFTASQEPAEGSLTLDCAGKGRICVLKHLCVNGRVVDYAKDLQQIRNGPQYCKIDREVCCTLTKTDSGFASAGSSSSGGYGESGSSNSFGSFDKTSQFGSSDSYDQSEQKESTNFGGQSFEGQSGNGYGEKIPLDRPTRPSGGFGVSFGQNSYDQSQQKESSNFGQFGNGYGQSTPSGFSLGTFAPTSGGSFKKPSSGGSYAGGSSSTGNTGSNTFGTFGQSNEGYTGVTYAPSSIAPTKGSFITVTEPSKSGSTLIEFGENLNTGREQGFSGFSTDVEDSSASNGYLPPIGSAPSGPVPAFSAPPKEDKEGGPTDNVPDFKAPPRRPTTFAPVPRPTFAPAPPVPVQVGCAAALICVEEQFCTMEGVISPERVLLTPQQIERRVPMSSCRNPDNGIIGKCCRDPNYVDPWPTGNLPANYSGGFDEQGFPSYLNYAKTHPPKKPTKGGFRQTIKTSFPTVTQRPLEKFFPGWDSFVDQANQFVSNFPFQSSTQSPTNPSVPTGGSETSGIPENPPAGSSEVLGGSSEDEPVSVPPSVTSTTPGPFSGFTFPSVFTLPTFANFTIPNFTVPNFTLPFQFGSNRNIEVSGSNENPRIIVPHTPGTQCGLRNKVQLPTDSDQDVVGFGEIPWQAMILSTNDRKLLCSGVIISPNAVLTAAHCVYGLNPSGVSIKAGEWKLGYELRQEEPLPFEIVKVSNIVPHPGYQPNSGSYDIAILFLEHPVSLDQHVDIICLGDIPQPTYGRKCIATGWGKTILQVHAAGALMHGIDVDIIPQDACRQRLQGAESQIEIDNTLTCVKAQKQRNNLCQVDVGGPLACDRGDGYYELTGIYSRETGCLPTNQVATFALIDTDWVKKTLLSPPQVPSPNYEVQVPNVNYPSAETRFESQITEKPAPACDCQKSYLPPELNQYLPPK